MLEGTRFRTKSIKLSSVVTFLGKLSSWSYDVAAEEFISTPTPGLMTSTSIVPMKVDTFDRK